ncbi:MAG: SDR family oxidoreductase [Acidimicrobiales bacterium]|jgi:NAD(P)-dependent dehydrogenase (short-subunit alcohol dehydrogenase family)|nr:SDR family oxidoreductase [Acidimicrobiales bacterium]
MDIRGKVAVVTGGASGIGQALVERFHAAGARALVVADMDVDGAMAVAAGVGGTGVGCDVADEAAVRSLIDDTVAAHGGVDLVVSNAGYVTVGGLEASDEDMRKMFDVHVMAHVFAARHAIPHMVDAGGGYLLNTASAAGLLTQIGSMHYSVTKHAAVALAEFISVTYGHMGIAVSVLCPQAVETNILANSPSRDQMPGGGAGNAASVDGVLTTGELAEMVMEGLADERFHILPHPDVAEYLRRKTDDVDRWLGGMRRFQQRLFPDGPTPADWLVG